MIKTLLSMLISRSNPRSDPKLFQLVLSCIHIKPGAASKARRVEQMVSMGGCVVLTLLSIRHYVTASPVVCCVALVSLRPTCMFGSRRVAQLGATQKNWVELNLRHWRSVQRKLSPAASTIAAIVPQGASLKMKGKHCVFVAASDLMWMQPRTFPQTCHA